MATAQKQSGSYAGHVLAVLGLVALSALIWVGSAAFAILVILADSVLIDGSRGDSPANLFGNHLFFGWLVPGLVLLVGLLGAEALGRSKAVAASAAVVGVQAVIVAGSFMVYG